MGADRLRFINAYVTCDVKALAPGGGAYGFFTNPQGKILSDVAVMAHEDRLWLEIGSGREEAISDHLKKYILADRVEIRGLEDMLPLTLAGPKRRRGSGWRRAAAAGGLAPRADGRPWHRGGPPADRRAGRGGLHPLGLGLDRRPARRTAAGDARSEAGRIRGPGDPAHRVAGSRASGRDFGSENFPQETGMEEAVSYTKGCYLGQEVVARIHYRGGVQKSLHGLDFGAGPARRPRNAPPPRGTGSRNRYDGGGLFGFGPAYRLGDPSPPRRRARDPAGADRRRRSRGAPPAVRITLEWFFRP